MPEQGNIDGMLVQTITRFLNELNPNAIGSDPKPSNQWLIVCFSWTLRWCSLCLCVSTLCSCLRNIVVCTCTSGVWWDHEHSHTINVWVNNFGKKWLCSLLKWNSADKILIEVARKRKKKKKKREYTETQLMKPKKTLEQSGEGRT